MTEAQAYGAESMTAPLEWALLRRPGQAFGRAFEDPELGFRHPVDLPRAVAEHEALVALLAGLGVEVAAVAEGASGDSVYVFDPLLVIARGAIGLRSGKPNRVAEADELADWCGSAGIPLAGRVDPPGTADGGDTF